MRYEDLPPDVKEAWDNTPGDVPFTSVGEIFDRWCDYNGLVHWGPKIRHTWLELQRVQSATTRRDENAQE